MRGVKSNKISTQFSLINFQNKNNLPGYNSEEFDFLLKTIRPEWAKYVSLCEPIKKTEEKLNIFEQLKNKMSSSKNDEKKGIIIARERGLGKIMDHYPLTEYVQFPFYFFDLKKFIIEERKFILVMREIQLLNIIGSIMNGLKVCRELCLPHGNLSLTTIFKKGKINWEISPPLYSRINLYKRREFIKNNKSLIINPDQEVDYLLTDEIHTFIQNKFESNFCC